MTDAAPADLQRRPPPSEWLAPGVLVPTFILLVTVGFYLFARGIGVAAGNEWSKHQAVMTAVNAATLTGLQQARNPSDYTVAGQAIVLGLIVVGILFSLIGGGLAVTRIARLPYRDRTIVLGAFLAVLLVGGLGAILGDGSHADEARFHGVFQALSAFGNCGLYVGQLPRAGEPRATAYLLPLAVLGSFGLPVLLDLLRCRPSAHAGRVLLASAAVYLGVLLTLVLATVTWQPMGTFGDSLVATLRTVPGLAVSASTVAINGRSAGFPFGGAYAPAVALLLVVAMVVGGAPAGTAGGIKVTTLATLATGLRDTFAGRPVRRAFGAAVAWLVLYVAVLLAITIGLLMTDPALPADRALFLASSALGNVGLSHDRVSPSTGGMYVLSVAMLLGRILPVMMLWTVADRMPEVDEPVG